MAEILYELGVEGGPETSSAFEDLRLKQIKAQEATKRLQDELRKLQASGAGTAAEIEQLQRRIIRADTTSQKLAKSAREVANAQNIQATAAQALAQRTAAVAQALGQVGGILGQIDPQLAELGQHLITVGQAAGAGGAAFGPWGAIIGGAIGVVQAYVGHLQQQEEAHRAAAAAARAQATDIERLMEGMSRSDAIFRLESGLGTVIEQTAALERAQAQLDAEHQRVRNTRAQLATASAQYHEIESRLSGAIMGNTGATRGLEAQQRRLHERIRSLRTDLDAFNVSLETQQRNTIALAGALKIAEDREDEEAREQTRADRRRRAAAAARAQAQALARELTALQRTAGEEEVRIFADARAEMRRLGLDHYATEVEALRAHLDTRRQMQAAETVWYRQELQARAQAEREVNQAIAEETRVLEETERQRQQVREQILANDRMRRMEDFEEQKKLAERAKASVDGVLTDVGSSVTNILGQAVTGIMSAIKEVAKGTMTAGEAFGAMLSSFLEMLSQMAALEAIKHYAAAIGEFASQNYAGGAAHIAAGVAWTVVAVAAGGAAVAAAPPAQREAPASPQASNDNADRGGGTTIVNFNSQVIAQERQELGRTLEDLIEEGRRARGGRAA